MPKNFFDIVCLGGDLSGLVAAALLAKQGYRTLVALGSQAPEGTPPEQGPDGAPMLFFGEQSSPVIRWAFSHLGLTQEVRNRLTAPTPLFQVVVPGHRVDVGGRSPDTDDEVRREFPELVDELDPLMATIEKAHESLQGLFDPPLVVPPVRWGQRRALGTRLRSMGLDDDLTVDDPLAHLPDHHPIRRLFDPFIHFLVGSDPRQLGALQRARLLGHLGRGVSTLARDRKGLTELLLERFATYGGVVERGAQATGITLSWGRSPVVTLGPNDEEVGCHLILHNGPVRYLPDLLPPTRKRRKLMRILDHVVTGAYRVTWAMEVAAGAIPDAMAELVVDLDPDNGHPDGEELLLLRVSGKGEQRVVTLTLHVDAETWAEEPPSAKDARIGRLKQRLDRLIPFYERHSSKPLALRSVVPLTRCEEAGLGRLGCLRYRSPYKHILLTGAEVLAGLGLEGHFLAGVSVSMLAQGVVKRRDLLPR